MRTIISIIIALLFLVVVANAQSDTVKLPVVQDDPSVKQSTKEIQRNMLEDMVKITSAQVPEGVKRAVAGNDFKGAKTFYKHKKERRIRRRNT